MNSQTNKECLNMVCWCRTFKVYSVWMLVIQSYTFNNISRRLIIPFAISITQ